MATPRLQPRLSQSSVAALRTPHAFNLELVVEECSGPSFTPDEMQLTALSNEMFRVFDLWNDSLMRVVLAKVEENDHYLLINLHHSVTDGRSLYVLCEELKKAFTAISQGQKPQLPVLPYQYVDYAFWHRSWLEGGELG